MYLYVYSEHTAEINVYIESYCLSDLLKNNFPYYVLVREQMLSTMSSLNLAVFKI